MSDSIFNADEIKADETGAADDTPPEIVNEVVAGAAEQATRDEQGRFAPKPDAEPDKSGTVPQGALHAEREKRKTFETQARQYKEQLDAIATMRARIAAQQPEPAPQIGEDDASQVAYLRQRLEQMEGTQNTLVQQRQAEQVDTAERQHLSAALSSSEAEFRAATPDYDAAIDHVVNARAQELALYGLNAVQVQQTLQQEVLDITRSAIEQGRAPAEVAYQLATLRGYRPETPQNGSQPPVQQQSAAQRTVEAVAAARAGSRSLGQASGSGPVKDINAATIAGMSDDEFQALYSTPEGRRMIDAL